MNFKRILKEFAVFCRPTKVLIFLNFEEIGINFNGQRNFGFWVREKFRFWWIKELRFLQEL